MDQVMDGGRLPLEAWFWEMPTCTRWWTAATIFTSALVQCQMVTPFQLFYSFRAVFVKSQVSTIPEPSIILIAPLHICVVNTQTDVCPSYSTGDY